MDIQTIYNLAVQRLEQAKQNIESRNLPLSTKTLETLQSKLNISTDPPIFTDFCAFAERVVGWIPLNPNDLQRVRAIISAYHLPGYDNYDLETATLDHPHLITSEYLGSRTNFHPVNMLPTRCGLITLFDAIVRSQNHFIALSGRRGSGKTVALNFFISTAHKALCSKGVLWLRTDIAKIWAYPDNFLSVTQYTILHSIFVGLRYAKDDDNLKPLDNNGEIFGEYLAALPTANSHNQRLYEIWNRMVSAYLDAVRRAKYDPDPKPVAEFLASGKNLIEEYGDFEIVSVYRELIAFLRESAHAKGMTLRILIILDGVDNIRVGAHQDRYFKLLKDIIYLIADVPPKVGDVFILVARPETFNDISIQNTMMQNGFHIPIIFNMDNSFVKEVVERKTKAINNPVEYFQSKSELLTGNKFIDTYKSRDFAKSVWSLSNRFEDAEKLAHKMAFDINSAKPIDLLFDGNLRSLLRNIIRAHHHWVHLSSRVTQTRALLEGSVLAGCASMPKNFDEKVHGHWCPNLFEHATLENGRWTGLVVIRLIQLLNAVSEGLTRNDAIEYLQSFFNYPRILCETAFQMSSEFSLIQCNGFTLDRFDVDNARPMNARLFVATVKGNYIMNLVFKDCAIFYFMSVNTPLDLARVKNVDINLNNLVHSSDTNRHFFRSVILSGVVLWAHICTANRQELSDLNINSIPSSAFELPDIDLWPSSAMQVLQQLSKNDLEIVSDALTKYATF